MRSRARFGQIFPTRTRTYVQDRTWTSDECREVFDVIAYQYQFWTSPCVADVDLNGLNVRSTESAKILAEKLNSIPMSGAETLSWSHGVVCFFRNEKKRRNNYYIPVQVGMKQSLECIVSEQCLSGSHSFLDLYSDPRPQDTEHAPHSDQGHNRLAE